MIIVLTALWWVAARRPWQPRPVAYATSLSFSVGVRPEPRTGDYYTYDRYYTWLAAEYLADDLSEVVRRSAFATAVSRRLADRGITVPPGAIQGSTQAGKLHRVLTLSITWGDAEQLAAIADAAITVLSQEAGSFLPQTLADEVEARLIDRGAIVPVGPGLRERLDLPLRLFLGLVIGLALVFLLDYLDDSVRDRADLEALGIPILGEIPRGNVKRKT
jgi:capsular polysaccharide biosynthesis protein